MCDIYKRGKARRQVVLGSTIWELQEDNDGKHMWKLALNWKASHRIEKIDWSSMSPDLAPCRKCLVVCQDEVKKNLKTCQSLICGNGSLCHQTWLLHLYIV